MTEMTDEEGGNVRSGGSGGRPITMPAVGRSSGVLRVSEVLEALGDRLLGDGKDTVL